MTAGPARARLGPGRWHFRHGPIDCIVDADGDPAAVEAAAELAWRRFGGLLDELVAELPLLRADLATTSVAPAGPVARRMVAACARHAADGRFITAMAAVAGSVADELIGPFAADPRIARAAVNDGGDIALHLAPGRRYAIGVVADLARGVAGHAPEGRIVVDAAMPVRGVATSGWRGRSLSLGIADAATVLAATAAAADAAATVLGNAVDVGAPGIVRRPANAVRDDSDLGERPVTVAVPALPAADVERALDAGQRRAMREIAAGRIFAAVLQLQGRVRVCGRIAVVQAAAPRPGPLPAGGESGQVPPVRPLQRPPERPLVPHPLPPGRGRAGVRATAASLTPPIPDNAPC